MARTGFQLLLLLDELSKFMEDEAHPINMLPKCTPDGITAAPQVQRHTIPPVAPIHVKAKGWDTQNDHLTEKFLFL